MNFTYFITEGPKGNVDFLHVVSKESMSLALAPEYAHYITLSSKEQV